MKRRSSEALALCCLGLLSAFGCQSVIGAKDRTLDPTLSHTDNTASTACSQYCTTVMTNCVGKNAQYVSRPVCLADCALMATGTVGAISGNTVQCRQKQAEIAHDSGEPDVQCAFAGPAGNGQCGSTCDSYCTQMMSTCPEAFPTSVDCQSACQTMPDLKTYDTSEQRGDSVQCRIFHVSAATQSKIHCGHASKVATAYCVASDGGTDIATSCDPPADADDCDRCEYTHCCTEVNDCYNDTICQTADDVLDTCIADGGSDQCEATFVASNAFAAAVHACKSQNCAAECGLASAAP